MPLTHVGIIIIVIGLSLSAANVYIPMRPTTQKIVNLVVIIAVAFWLFHILSARGNISPGG